MAKSSGQKLKLLYLIKMLRENTDENHPMSTPDIIKYLENQGIHAERKSIYNDMECLADFGYDVVQVQSRLGGGYYLGSREFELPELKLLVDAVQSSRFITDLPREGVEQFSQIDVTSYTNQTFGMFAGEESVVTMEFPVRLTGVVLDRFGRETDIRPMSEEVFRIRAKVAVSGQFFGWLAGIGQGARIVAPEAVQKRYVQWLSDILREQSQEAE